MGVVLIDAFQMCSELLLNFHGENPVALHLRCVIVHKTLFSQSFRRENMAMGVTHFHDENPVEFCVWWAIAHRQGFASMFMARINMLNCDEPKPFKASSMLMRVAYTGKPISLGEMDQDYHTAMIMHTIKHECAPTTIDLSAYPHYKVKSNHDLQRVIRITMRVHHTNCTVTHTRASACAHTRTHTESRKVK